MLLSLLLIILVTYRLPKACCSANGGKADKAEHIAVLDANINLLKDKLQSVPVNSLQKAYILQNLGMLHDSKYLAQYDGGFLIHAAIDYYVQAQSVLGASVPDEFQVFTWYLRSRSTHMIVSKVKLLI